VKSENEDQLLVNPEILLISHIFVLRKKKTVEKLAEVSSPTLRSELVNSPQ